MKSSRGLAEAYLRTWACLKASKLLRGKTARWRVRSRIGGLGLSNIANKTIFER
ncbi:hypothetical protein MPTK1_6g07250 [Marchantia polymorpha subsp. ruderalis]|uniref:Uncharacterized protein n=2 Tax=Marchantia polymorpha TaxID=3197 RepID=A0AAF6BPG0_MARPO|nr:hypothetical protein MARPO_0053s0039 [Marchantia polymorpha]BBN13894.1 hypothetical protein Mp_6g07250 [Marchantia polymorpha subsp. ruderalis]|eukprot:PTQ38095.1 hypothetical protein MARPO_0053s0039 [Marchantia polymorpha]